MAVEEGLSRYRIVRKVSTYLTYEVAASNLAEAIELVEGGEVPFVEFTDYSEGRRVEVSSIGSN